MCGIVGYWPTDQVYGADQVATAERLVARMAGSIEHRGPDDSGAWVDPQAGVALGHRRLSIVDLSQAGHQPMVSACQRYVLTYNGEIYNHVALREELERSGHAPIWRGHSDTETLLASIAHWGVADTLAKCNGMFAFALWDRQQRQLVLARDRLGEKPLYYGHSNGCFFFTSELKALKQHPRFSAQINRDVLASYFRFQYVPTPYCIYEGMRKLQPGHFVIIDTPVTQQVKSTPYWVLNSSDIQLDTRSPHALEDSLDDLLRDSISKRLMADVPVGAFLSGGYDSSLVVALAQALSQQPVQTFSIGFSDPQYNEAQHAKAVAQHLGTDHCELYVEPADALNLIPKLANIWCEPFSDSSQIPTFLVGELAASKVKVCLSGDGGDELFYGYTRYFKAAQLWGQVNRLPRGLRRLLAMGAASVPQTWLSWLAQKIRPGSGEYSNRMDVLADIFSRADGQLVYRELVSHWKQPEELVLGASSLDDIFTRSDINLPDDLESQMMQLDTLSYLPDDILVKVDRATMANSLESRLPLLDHRLVEFAQTLPLACKTDGVEGKKILKKVMHRYVPEEMMKRPKMGFGVPIDAWLRGPLQDWAQTLLDSQRLNNEGYLNSELVQRRWREHLNGTRDWHYYLWDVLMFQAWLENESC